MSISQRLVCGLTTLALLTASAGAAMAASVPPHPYKMPYVIPPASSLPKLPYAVPYEAPAKTTPAQETQLAKGEIVVNFRHANPQPVYYLDVYGMINAPAESVWNAITSYNHYQEFLPLVVDSDIAKKTPRHCWQYVRMRPPMMHDHWMVNANVENKASWNLSWTMAEGNLRYEHGYWQIRPVGPDRCILQYHLTVDPWLDVVPNWLVEFATKTVLPGVIKGVRKRVGAA